MGWLRSSVLSYPERGPWGRADYPGNCSGYLLVDLIKQYQPRNVLDPMAGSYTVKEVCDSLGISCDAFDLRDGFDALTDRLPAKKYDLIFLHPPYWNMIRYSDNQRDLSASPTLQHFVHRLSTGILRFSEYLGEEGRIAVLIGNLRRHARYYPLGAYLEALFHEELREELIKLQHNVSSAGKHYAGEDFVPIIHEKVLVLAGFRLITWSDLVLRTLEELGGSGTTHQIYEKLQNHPKRVTNPTWKATVAC